MCEALLKGSPAWPVDVKNVHIWVSAGVFPADIFISVLSFM
jgi:hypothetical protein